MKYESVKIPPELLEPPREFSVMPFWFWNDALNEAEIVRQINDFEAHGVYGFVLHPRIGLPHDLAWMSDRLLDFYSVAIEEAARRQMKVLLYDEGMYPSGSSAGQVVAANPAFACRCLAKVELGAGENLELKDGANLVAIHARADGTRVAIIDRKADSIIRGVHYQGEGPVEETHPAADILNPDAVATFIRLVYDRFAARFSRHFGKTIFAMFTDEPGLLGRCRERDVHPGTTGIMEHVNRILGYDFTPHLPALWEDGPDAGRFREDYTRAVRVRLEETYYRPISQWCERHRLPLTGHPEKADDLGLLRHFHIPGQDLVWRWVIPDHPSALEGRESTQAKCSASAALHAHRRRNSNECCGAYGHELTWDEMQWLARWCFVRGVNLLYPHAFYYSIRGLRWDERPPDVGPHSPWWGRYREYADACRRLSWLNTDGEHVCDLAILGKADDLPWRPAKACFRHQRDFNYLEERVLLEQATVAEDGIHVAGMTYRALIVDRDLDGRTTRALASCPGRIIRYDAGMEDAELVRQVASIIPAADITVSPSTPALRVRHVRKGGFHWYMLFNECAAPQQVEVTFSAKGERLLVDAATGKVGEVAHDQIPLTGYELKVFAIPEEAH